MVVRSTPLNSTANDKANTLTMVLIIAKVDENVTRSNAGKCSRNRRTRGTSGTDGLFASASFNYAKTTVSAKLRRIQTAKTVMKILIRNGMRQPQLNSSSSGSMATGMNTRVASTMPNMIPDAVKLAKNDRRYSGACS